MDDEIGLYPLTATIGNCSTLSRLTVASSSVTKFGRYSLKDKDDVTLFEMPSSMSEYRSQPIKNIELKFKHAEAKNCDDL